MRLAFFAFRSCVLVAASLFAFSAFRFLFSVLVIVLRAWFSVLCFSFLRFGYLCVSFSYCLVSRAWAPAPPPPPTFRAPARSRFRPRALQGRHAACASQLGEGDFAIAPLNRK